MQILMTLILVVQILAALAIVVLVLLQHGKGADMGASFGSGASGSLFGATGSANFLSRSTAVAATIFFAATLMMAYFGNLRGGEGGLMEKLVTAPPAASAAAKAATPASAPISQIPTLPATTTASTGKTPGSGAAPASGAK